MENVLNNNFVFSQYMFIKTLRAYKQFLRIFIQRMINKNV